MDPLKIGITCYPSIGGSGILAVALGEALADRGHEVHFISYERPVRLSPRAPRLFFHPVAINDYGLFRYPDYTLPLSVKMAEVSAAAGLELLHVHYAVPHATAALLARAMLGEHRSPRLVTTLHGTDTTLLGNDPGYGPAIRHALTESDGVTTVSNFMERETRRLLAIHRPIEVIPNFFAPKLPHRTRRAVRAELGVEDKTTLIVHSSNLRPVKRFDLLLAALAQLPPGADFKLLVLAGDSFDPYRPQVARLGLEDRVVVRERVVDIEEYLQAADLALMSSETESFCLSLLEAMFFGCPSVATAVGGIPEVVDHGQTGLLVPFGDPAALARAVQTFLADPGLRLRMGAAARTRALKDFSAETIVPLYESYYRRVLVVGKQ